MAKAKRDRRILSLIPSDYFVSVADLGEWTRTPCSTVHRAVKRLESKGLIRVVNRNQRPKPLRVILNASMITTRT
jgi:DeoR/GlpR family transcriptional regulator of sugar metabolism